MEKIKLSDIIMAYLDFREEPTEERANAMFDYKQHLQIREYLPITDKQISLALILSKIEDNQKDAVALQMNLEIAKIVYGLLSYIVNLENDLGFEALLNSSLCDALYENGFVDYVCSFCGKDYQRLERMVAETINFSNISKVCEVAALMSPENLEEFIKVTKELDLSISSDKVKELAKIYDANNPEQAVFNEALESAIITKVMTKETANNAENHIEDEPVSDSEDSSKA